LPRTFRILSIDGGGLRGIIAIKILQHLEEITGKRIDQMFDLIAGTSTGALIAAGLTYRDPEELSDRPKHSLETLEDLYTYKGETIFPYPKLRIPCLNYLKRRFDSNGIKAVLKEYFPATAKLSNCYKPLLITTYDIKTGSPLFFKTRDALTDKNSRYNPTLQDICLATSAAPTYLPSHQMQYWDNDTEMAMEMIDGGVFMNNPSIASLAEVLKYADWYRSREPTELKEISLPNISLMSIGTGRFKKPVGNKALKYGGQIFWAQPAIDILMGGNNHAIDYQCRQLLPSSPPNLNYIRLNVDLKQNDAGKIYEDMADSRSHTRNYWLERFEKDYLKNGTIQSEVTAFLKNASIDVLPSPKPKKKLPVAVLILPIKTV
jgi:patatin-like phospholipase/acyl hydrolase